MDCLEYQEVKGIKVSLEEDVLTVVLEELDRKVKEGLMETLEPQ
jgi:hypothetical protein